MVPGPPEEGETLTVPGTAITGVKGNMAAASRPKIQAAENILKNRLNLTNCLPFLF